MLGVLFVAVSVLPSHAAAVWAHSRDDKADNTRFTTRDNRAVAASLVAVENSRRTYTQRQMDEALGLLRKSPREVYMAWAARAEASSPGSLPTDPLW